MIPQLPDQMLPESKHKIEYTVTISTGNLTLYFDGEKVGEYSMIKNAWTLSVSKSQFRNIRDRILAVTTLLNVVPILSAMPEIEITE